MVIELVVDNRVRMRTEGVAPAILDGLRQAFEHENKHRYAMQRMGLPVWQEPRKLVTWAQKNGELSFPRGGFGRVRDLLADAGHEVSVRDAREHGTPTQIPVTTRTLYPHQERIVRAAVEREQCLIRSPTASGKTSALIAVAAELGVPTLVVVPTKGLLDQWRERVQEELGLRDAQIGIVGGGKAKLRPITLAIQRSVTKHSASKEFREYFGCLLFDEVHQAPAHTAYAAVDAMPARYRIGVSADVRRKDQKECLMHDLFGDVAVDVDRRELVASGHILDAEVRLVPTVFEAPWYGVRDEADAEDERHIDFMRLVKEIAADGTRNQEIVRIVRDEVVRGDQVLVLAHLREHCMLLGQMIGGMGTPTGYLLGGADSASEFERTCSGLKSGKIRVGVGTYKAIGTGIDLPRVAVAVAVTPILANRQFFGQVRGRVCRTAVGKTGARMFVMLDARVFPRHAQNAASWNAQTVVRVESGEWEPARQWLRAAREAG